MINSFYEKIVLQNPVHAINFAHQNRHELFLQVPEHERADVLLALSKHVQYDVMSCIDNDELVLLLQHLDPDESTDLIQLLPKQRQSLIIEKFSKELQEVIEVLKQFDPESAAGLMNLDYIIAKADDTIADVAKKFKKHEKRTGRLPVIFVTQKGKLKGYVPGHELGFSKPSDKTLKHVRKISAISHDASHDDVVHLFRSHPHNKIAVIGSHENVMGVIYSDDILKALKEEETSALYDFAGVHDEESVTDGVKQKVLHRYQWLIINLATAFLASFVVGQFDEIISKYVLLAVYMPIVAGMGGNAGTQTLAVLVRGIALNQIDLFTAWPTLRREVMAGVINGLINGILVAAVVLIVNHDAKIAFILGIAMIANLFIAGFFGTLVPLVMQKIGKDPAASATVFITTATDVLGFLAFLGLATIILN